jgi:hypothetical protein
MSSYLVVETPASGEPKTKAFVRLEDLHKWASNELFGKTDATVEVRKEIEERLAMYKEIEEFMAETFKYSYESIDSTDEHLKEYRKEFELFNEDPKYVYYYAKSILFEHFIRNHCEYMGQSCYNKLSDDYGFKIHEYFEKAYNFKLPEGKIFKKCSPYHKVVKALHQVFGKVLPQLAYALRFSYFDEICNIFICGNELSLPDMNEPEKLWVQEFVNTFYEPAKGIAVKRTDFVAHFNKHINELLTLCGIKDKVREIFKYAFTSSPEKVIDLPMIRRSAGMYITDLQRKHTTSDSIVEPTEHKNPSLLKYNSLDLMLL